MAQVALGAAYFRRLPTAPPEWQFTTGGQGVRLTACCLPPTAYCFLNGRVDSLQGTFHLPQVLGGGMQAIRLFKSRQVGANHVQAI